MPERRLNRTADAPRATTADVLRTVEDAVLLLGGGRLADQPGTRALEVLSTEPVPHVAGKRW